MSETSAAVERKKETELPDAKKQRKKQRVYIAIACVEAVVILCLMLVRWLFGGWWLTWDTGKDKVDAATATDTNAETVVGDFVAPSFDNAAVDGVPTVAENLGWSALTVEEGYVVHVCGVLEAYPDGTLPVYFSSEADNTVWVKLRVVDEEGKTIGESGIIKPGQYVENVLLAKDAVSGSVTLQIMGYEPETYYSAGSVGLATVLTMN